MTLRNFDTDLDLAGVTRLTSTVAVTERVEVLPLPTRPAEARTHLLSEGSWDWRACRDYVALEIEQRFGAFPRDPKKESGIFKSFVERWGDQAQAIARYAFEVCEGRWAGAPISINRFCKASDPFFAQPILDKLPTTPVQGW